MARDKQFTPQQKLTLGIVILIGVTTFVFGAFHLDRAIWLPFVRDPSAQFKTTDQLQQERIAQLKKQDTDGDGLSDYDELYVFGTSPFLKDTDSDGIPDGVEVAQGTDPNCPQGQTCRQPNVGTSTGSNAAPAPAGSAVVAGPGSTSGSTATLPGTTAQQQQVLKALQDTFGNVATLTPQQMADKIKSLPSDKLRSFLQELGVSKAALDKADDATLRKYLTEALTQTQQNSNVQAAENNLQQAQDQTTSGSTTSGSATSGSTGTDTTTTTGGSSTTGTGTTTSGSTTGSTSTSTQQ